MTGGVDVLVPFFGDWLTFRVADAAPEANALLITPRTVFDISGGLGVRPAGTDETQDAG